MDPDGLSILITVVGGLLMLLFSYCGGSLCANDSDKEQRSALGFSSGFSGICVCLLFACAIFVYGLLRMFSFSGGLIWAAIVFAIVCIFAILCTGLGGVRSNDNPEAFAFFKPIGAVFKAPALLIFKLSHLAVHDDVTEEDFLNLVDDVAEDDVIDEHQKEMITNIVELNDVTAGEIMTHRTEVISVNEAVLVNEVVVLAAKNGVSRLPVYRKNMDDIVGVLYAKDLFTAWDDEQRRLLPVSQFMRPAMFVPEARPSRELLIDFRVKHTQIAIVVDEYGGTSGVVTMEDILEEIVGNIQDEFDNEAEEIAVQANGTIIATGSADLEEVFDAFGMEMPKENEEEEPNFDNVNGLVIDKLGHIPQQMQENEMSVEYGGIVFTVLKVGERRVESVLCQKAEEKAV